MLYWICPECGHECSPAIRECPTCTAPPEAAGGISALDAHPEPRRSAPEGAPNELLLLAQNFQSASSVGLLALPVKLALKEPAKPAAEKEPEPTRKMPPLDGLAVKPARPARSEPLQPVPAPVPAPLASPAVDAPRAFSRPEFSLQAAGPAPAAQT